MKLKPAVFMTAIFASMALIGCGVQAEYQLIALNEIFRIKSVSVYGRLQANARAFIRRMRRLRLEMKISRNIETCVSGADIVVTTTPSRKNQSDPVILYFAKILPKPG